MRLCSCSFKSLRHSAFLLIVFLTGLAAQGWSVSRPQLPEKYKKWLQEDVVYIITNEEKKIFLDLPTDTDRDRFIDHFWEVRNPNPGSPENAYRDEHYRRIEYANQFFGHSSHTPGWRTDMGRVYITLGEPAQRQKLLGLNSVTPMEIWFYSNGNPALPPFFYVIFYQRDVMDEFRTYHPYSDGPEKLVTALVAPNRQQALKTITDQAGKDVARETLSLIPDEPVDFDTGRGSLASEVMLATIRDLANNPLSKAQLESHRRLLEDVSHRIVVGEEFLDAETVALRDPAGNTNLHYVLRLKKPDDFTVGQSEKQGYYYSILVSAKVRDESSKLIFSDDRKVSRPVSTGEFDEIKGKVFGYEGLLPLPPGKYKVAFELTNLLSNFAYHRDLDVTVPSVPTSGLQVSSIVPFFSAAMVPRSGVGLHPFSGAGVWFVPRAGQELQLNQGEPLKVFYQVWAQGLPNGSTPDRKLDVQYVFGRMGAQDTKTISDEIPLNQLDRGGSIINGKQIPTEDLAPGSYRLVLTLRDPGSQAKVFGSLSFSVSSSNTASTPWDVTEPASAAGERAWQRALCYLMAGDKSQAETWLRAGYSENSADERFRNKLIELYFDQQNYAKATELFSTAGLSEATDEQTIVRVAESFSKLGNLQKAVSIMESGVTLNPKSGSLQLGLADYYRRAGNLEKAAAAEQRGKQLMALAPAS